MLSTTLMEEILSAALSAGADFAELFVEDSRSTNLTMSSGQVTGSLSGRDCGAGIRIFRGVQSVYAYTHELRGDRLVALARQAAGTLPGPGREQRICLQTEPRPRRQVFRLAPWDVEQARKLALMREASEAVTGYSPDIAKAVIQYMEDDQSVQIANSDGRMAEDRRVRSWLAIEAHAQKNSEIQSGQAAPGAHAGFEFFDQVDVRACGREAARMAVTMLHASPCPSGRFPVILGGGNGILFHEACGHGLEATFVARNLSVFADKLGQQVASEAVTLIDDGSLRQLLGSQDLDDEGEPTKQNILIEKGILKGFLVDKLNGRRLGMAPTGSARRQSYRFAPTSRMTNTYILPGAYTREEIIANTEYGIYAPNLAGGQVNTATGQFSFGVLEAYIVRNGAIAEPVRGAVVSGNGAEALRQVEMVGNDLGYAESMCGSISGRVAVTAGQPTIRFGQLTVTGPKGV